MEYLPGDERREIRWSLDGSTGEMMPFSYPIKHKDSHARDADATDADAGDDDASEAESIDSQDARVAAAPRWKSGRFFSSPLDKYGAIWCWHVQTRDGHRTRIWEFCHHSGEWAYGTEPLSFFEDWDSAVDSAIPTPRSRALLDFCEETRSSCCVACSRNRRRCVRSLVGSTVELFWRLRPPAGAVLYLQLIEPPPRRADKHIEAACLPSAGGDAHLDTGAQPQQALTPATAAAAAAAREKIWRLLQLVRSWIRKAPTEPGDRLHPRWKWGLFFPQNQKWRPWERQRFNTTKWIRTEYDIYYWRDPEGSPTQVWRFGRGKKVRYARTPEAETERAEPTPFCRELRNFWDQEENCTCGSCNCLFDFLGQTTCLLPLLQPPDGATLYRRSEDPLVESERFDWADERVENGDSYDDETD